MGSDRNSVNQKIFFLSVFGIISVVLLIVLVNIATNLNDGIRVYIAGENIWAKAQKEATLHLTGYIITENEEDYRQFENSLLVNKNFRLAREEVFKEDYDHQVVYNALTQGSIKEFDVSMMIFLTRNFAWIPGMDKAFSYWEQAEEKIFVLRNLGEKIHSEIQDTSEVPEAQKMIWSQELTRLDNEFTELEIAFSDQMQQISRRAGSTLKWGAVIISFLIIGIGSLLAIWFLKSTQKWALSVEKSETKFKNVLNNSRDLIYKVRLSDGGYEFVSPAVKYLLGFTSEEFMEAGTNLIVERTHPDDLERINKVVENYEKGDEERFVSNLEFRVRHKSGEYRWFSNTRKLVKDEDGTPTAIVGNARDITEQKQQEAKIQESLKEKEVLLQEIHHRVKNNLTIVSSLLELQKTGVDDEVKKLLEDSQNRIKSIAKVHEKLYQTSNLSEIQLQDYAEGLLDELKLAYDSDQKSIELQTDIDPVSMDINKTIYCGLVLNELVNNAYKHAFTDQESGIIRISAKQQEKAVRIEVANNGKELPDDYNPYQGDSLGMTLVNVLSQKYNGSLDVETGEWTRFIISLYDE